MKPKVCYISNFYLGERRVEVEAQKHDRLLYLKFQIESLIKYDHNLSKIIFNFNFRKEDIKYLNDIIKLTPKEIKGTPVELFFRENKGMSYGAWSDTFIRYQNEFDYYIFNEDDYFINDHKALNKVYQKYGRLLGEMDDYTQKHIGGDVHPNGQVAHTLVFTELGYDLYDIREKYRILHSMGGSGKSYFELYFQWNEPHLILPATAKVHEPLRYYEKTEKQFLLPGINNKYEKKVT
jgi:hypothetical protein